MKERKNTAHVLHHIYMLCIYLYHVSLSGYLASIDANLCIRSLEGNIGQWYNIKLLLQASLAS